AHGRIPGPGRRGRRRAARPLPAGRQAGDGTGCLRRPPAATRGRLDPDGTRTHLLSIPFPLRPQSMPQNPLLDFSGPPRFDAIRPEHVAPAVAELLARAETAVRAAE